MKTPVVYDMSRLLLRSFARGPNGIDRVDRNLARHFLHDGARRNLGIVLNKLLPVMIDRDGASALLDVVDAAWGSDLTLANDRMYHSLRRAILAPSDRVPGSQPRMTRPPPLRATTALRIASIMLPQLSALRSVPNDAVFIHATHFPDTQLFRWLDGKPDIKSLFFIHDLLPLQRPDFFTSENAASHRQFLEVFLRHGCAAVVNTDVVKDDVLAFLREQNREGLPVLVAPMPAEAVFAQPGLVDSALRTIPYFVMCGTIEPRKNHRLILDLWETMVRQDRRATPRLVILGSRGWNNADVFNRLDRAEWAKSHIIEAAGLTSQAMAAIIANARALLMPSFAEGYGLPIVEALAAGTPVIASDIPVFREIAETNVEYCEVNDRTAWLAAIDKWNPSRPRISARGNSALEAEKKWENYFWKIDTFIDTLQKWK